MEPNELIRKSCAPCERGTDPLSEERVEALLPAVPGWECREGMLRRTFTFKNYYQTMAFVNAVAWIAHREDHHPDLEVSYRTCGIRYATHSIGGLSENDFICAAKVNALAPEG